MNLLNHTHASLRKALILCSAPLLMFGCANQPKSTPAPVVEPVQNQTSQPSTSLQPLPATITVETPTKASVIATVAAPAPPGAILPANNEDSSLSESHIKQAQKNLRKVVILLPDRPSLAEVNRDIEKGIRAAHQYQPHNPNLQLVFLHDALTGEALMQKATAHAPDWMIGPLTKGDIQSVQTLTSERHIFLNRVESPSKAVQMSLAIEDEIDQLLTAFSPNLGQVAIIASNDATEQRLLNDINTKAKALQLTTTLISVEKQNPDIRNWLIKEGGIQSSQDRITRLTQVLRADLSDSAAQARKDIQGVIFLGNAKQLRSIMPSLSYYQVSWPIYATSRLLPSTNTQTFNEPELNGVNLLVPPYLQSTRSPNNLFEALGWDSYLMLANPQAQGANTQSGKFENQNNQLKRQLLWQHIKSGQLVDGKRP